MVFKAKVQTGRGQLLNETVFYRLCKVDIDLLENDMCPLCGLILALHGTGKYYSFYIGKTCMQNHWVNLDRNIFRKTILGLIYMCF